MKSLRYDIVVGGDSYGSSCARCESPLGFLDPQLHGIASTISHLELIQAAIPADFTAFNKLSGILFIREASVSSFSTWLIPSTVHRRTFKHYHIFSIVTLTRLANLRELSHDNLQKNAKYKRLSHPVFSTAYANKLLEYLLVYLFL